MPLQKPFFRYCITMVPFDFLLSLPGCLSYLFPDAFPRRTGGDETVFLIPILVFLFAAFSGTFFAGTAKLSKCSCIAYTVVSLFLLPLSYSVLFTNMNDWFSTLFLLSNVPQAAGFALGIWYRRCTA